MTTLAPEHDARALVDRYKDQVVSEITAGYAKEMTAMIIGYGLPGTRRCIMETLEKEASDAYKTGHYEIALDRFCHYLAVVETDPSTTMVSEMRATLTSNIGACLHNLGLVDDAVQYYERALQEFKAVPFTLLSRLSPIRLVYGNLMTHRCEYIEKKLASIRAGEPPDGSTYQDGYGKSRKWTKEEMDGKNTWSWLNPTSWFGYGKISEINVAPTAANAA